MYQFYNTQDHIMAIEIQIPTNISKNIIIVICSDKEYNIKFWLVKVLEKYANNNISILFFIYFMYYIIF
jgi:hypothetical protein